MKYFLKITKPKIVFGNLISMSSCYFFASHENKNYYLFIILFFAVFLIISSCCALNNYIDKDIDAIMKRTKNRQKYVLSYNKKKYLTYFSILCILGVIILKIVSNNLTTILSVIGIIIYIIVYSLYMKRKSIYSIHFGSLSGSIPPLIGYCSIKNKLDTCSFIIFLIFCLWQIPHSFAIEIINYEDYKNANIPTFPKIKGILTTKIHALIYTILFTITNIVFYKYKFVGYKYFFVVIITSMLWIVIEIFGFKKNKNNILWAKKVFVWSIITIIIVNIMISIDSKI